MDLFYTLDSVYKVLIYNKSIYTTKNYYIFYKNYDEKLPYIKNTTNDKLYIPFCIKIFWNEPVNIIDNIYIGNICNASNWSIIRDFNFIDIINLTNNIPNYFENQTHITYLKTSLDGNNIENSIDNILDYIFAKQTYNNTKSNLINNILIHSFGGTNIVLVIAISLLITKYNFKFNKAINFVYSKNSNFNLDIHYYNLLKNKYS